MEPTLRNDARDRLQGNDIALGIGVRPSRTVAAKLHRRSPIPAQCRDVGYRGLFYGSPRKGPISASGPSRRRTRKAAARLELITLRLAGGITVLDIIRNLYYNLRIR